MPCTWRPGNAPDRGCGLRRRPICRVNDLEATDAKGYSLPREDGTIVSLIVVRKDNNIFVYENRCPHTGINLEWQPDQFFDAGGGFLQCATHGALFRPEDGYCLRGPCTGDSLEPVPFRVINGEVLIET